MRPPRARWIGVRHRVADDEWVQCHLLDVLDVQAERVIDGLEKQPAWTGEDRSNHIHQLSKIGDADRAAAAYEDIEIGRDRQRVGQRVALLQAGPLATFAVPDIPLVVGDSGHALNALRVARPVDERLANAECPLRLVGRQNVTPVVIGAGVDMDRVVVDVCRQAVDHAPVPVAPSVSAATDELDGGIRPANGIGPAPGRGDVLIGGQMTNLPLAIHLVAQAPVANVVRLSVTVRAAQVRPVRIASAVAVFDPGAGLIQRARAHVEADVRLGAKRATVLDELVGPERVRLLGVPGDVESSWSLLDRADTVGPVIAAYEVPTRPAKNRRAERASGIQHVTPEATLVTEG